MVLHFFFVYCASFLFFPRGRRTGMQEQDRQTYPVRLPLPGLSIQSSPPVFKKKRHFQVSVSEKIRERRIFFSGSFLCLPFYFPVPLFFCFPERQRLLSMPFSGAAFC